jgi:hypothetical protein
MSGSIEFFKLRDVCHVEMENYWNITDEFGSVNFEKFRVVRGPVGLYSFKVVTRNFE